MRDCKIFWAFSDEQFMEGKTPLTEGDKYISIGAGGYMPKSLVKKFIDGQKEIAKWYKASIKNSKQTNEEILYELKNHECFYIGDIEGAIGALPNYSREQIQKVFNENYESCQQF